MYIMCSSTHIDSRTYGITHFPVASGFGSLFLNQWGLNNPAQFYAVFYELWYLFFNAGEFEIIGHL